MTRRRFGDPHPQTRRSGTDDGPGAGPNQSSHGLTGRRDFLRTSLGAALGWGLSHGWVRAAPSADLSRFRGIFPIMQTPYGADGNIVFDELEKQVKFLDRAGVHGMVWPQLASQYAELSFDERIKGAERIVAAGKGLRPAIVIGVQASDTATALKYARHAEKLKPDAIVALPTRRENLDLKEAAKYYAAIADACGLPLFIQTTGNMSVEFVLGLARDIPSLHFVKDEAGRTLDRIGEFGRSGPNAPAIFTGGHGRTLIDEMMRGSAGNMPAAGWVDLYVRVWDLWQAGKRSEALDMFSKVMLFVTQAGAYGIPALHYVLHLRGVFSTWEVRGKGQHPLDDLARESLKQTYEFVKPHFTA